MSDFEIFEKYFEKATRQDYTPIEEVEYTEWEIISKGIPKYDVTVYFDPFRGPIGDATWKRTMKVEERRYKIKKVLTGAGLKEESRKPETRTRTITEMEKTSAYRVDTGGDIEEGDFAWSINPWTGETATRRY